ncbi:MAG: hypothetical protein HYV18_09275, partial [Gammaproteobacteria bacterium]|nr:hypothetical protein [Gammaproteobacteria bacterium]
MRYGAMAAAAAAVVLSACGESRPASPAGAAPRSGPHPLVSAHRGGAAYAPENTMPAFRNALRLGADQIETDAQLTADGALVLIHDDTLDRTTDCSGAVSAKTLAQVRDCDAAYWFSPGQPTTIPVEAVPHSLRGQGVRVPEARELFALLRSLGEAAPDLSIEIKDIPGESNFDPAGADVAAALVPLIQEYGLQRKTIVQSFWPAALEQVRLLDPTLRTQFLTTTSTGQTAAQNVAWTIARQHDVAAPNFDAPDFNAELVAAAQAAGRQVIPYTPDRAAELEQVAALGVDGIITNFPGCLLRLQGRLDEARVLPDEVAGELPPCPGETVARAAPPRDRPDPAACAALRPARWLPAQGQPADRAALR